MSAQYFNWTVTGMRFAAERQPYGPMQYVRADDHDKLKREVEGLLKFRESVDEACNRGDGSYRP